MFNLGLSLALEHSWANQWMISRNPVSQQRFWRNMIKPFDIVICLIHYALHDSYQHISYFNLILQLINTFPLSRCLFHSNPRGFASTSETSVRIRYEVTTDVTRCGKSWIFCWNDCLGGSSTGRLSLTCSRSLYYPSCWFSVFCLTICERDQQKGIVAVLN